MGRNDFEIFQTYRFETKKQIQANMPLPDRAHIIAIQLP
jgi:hypothetical protein